MLKKKKTLSTQRKKENKNSVLSVVRKFGAERGGLCGLFFLNKKLIDNTIKGGNK
jgi:hypothetical protein